MNIDQLINFYSYTRRFELCQEPLDEILKIMDKRSFKYEVDLTSDNHVYYYITACLYCLKTKSIVDFSRAIHYLMNVINIIYKNAENFEPIPPIFYENVFQIIKAYTLNNGKPILFRKNELDLKSSLNVN